MTVTPKRVRLGIVSTRRRTNRHDFGPSVLWEIREVGSQQRLGEWADDAVEPKVTRVRGHASRSG